MYTNGKNLQSYLFQNGKNRLKKELKEKEIKKKNESSKSKKSGMKFLGWIINSILIRELGNIQKTETNHTT
jgi:hypothetical protein